MCSPMDDSYDEEYIASFLYSDESDYEYIEPANKEEKRHTKQAPSIGSISSGSAYSGSSGTSSRGYSSALYHPTRDGLRHRSNIRSIKPLAGGRRRPYIPSPVKERKEPVYENLPSRNTVDGTKLYGLLLKNVLVNLLETVNGREKVKAVLQKVERILRIRSGITLEVNDHEFLIEEIGKFGQIVEKRLLAIRELSLVGYRMVADSHSRTGNRKYSRGDLTDEMCLVVTRARQPTEGRFTRIRKSIRRLFTKNT